MKLQGRGTQGSGPALELALQGRELARARLRGWWWGCLRGTVWLTAPVSHRAAVARGLLQQVASEAEGTHGGPAPAPPGARPHPRGPGGGEGRGRWRGAAPGQCAKGPPGVLRRSPLPWTLSWGSELPAPCSSLTPAGSTVRSVAAAPRSLGPQFWKRHRRPAPPAPQRPWEPAALGLGLRGVWSTELSATLGRAVPD